MSRTDTEIAWAAGLFEGEGSCYLASGQRQPRVSLEMTDEDVVRRFAAAMGRGNVRYYDTLPSRTKPTWQWSVQSRDDVLFVLNRLWPFLGQRRREKAYEIIERASALTSRAGARTHCKRGHDFAIPGNLYVQPKTGRRQCARCRAEYARGRVLRPAA